MKRILLLFLLSLAILPVNAQEEPKGWTLQEIINYALENNIQIQQTFLDVEEADIDQKDALGNYLPGVSANMSNSWNSGLTQDVTTGILEQQTTRSFSMGATASVPIFHGLRNLKQWQRAKLSKLASQYALEKMKDDVLLNVTNAYLMVLVNKERLKVLKEQNALTLEQLEHTRVLINEGAAPAGDSLEIKATDANEKQLIVTTRNDIKLSLINLAQMLQIDDYKNFDVVHAEYEIPVESMLIRTPEEIIISARENRYEIKLAEKDLELAEKDVEIARSFYYPSLDGYVNFNTRESGARRGGGQYIDPNNPTRVIGTVEGTGENVITNNYLIEEVGPRPFFKQLSQNKGWSYGLQLSIPIFNGFSTRNSVQRSKINVQRNLHQLKQARLNLESNVYQAYVDAQGAAEAFQAARVTVDSRKRSFQYSQDRYEVGKITAFEFSQAKFNLADAESQLVNAKYDFIFKLKVLELYFGIDPEDLKL